MSCRMCRMILKRSSFSLCGFCLCLGSWWSCRDDAFSCELFSWLYLIDIPSTATFNMVSELTVNTLYQQKSLTLHCFPPRSLNFTNKYFSRNSNERTLCYQNKSWFERSAQSPKFSGKSNELFWKVLIIFLIVMLVFSPGFSVCCWSVAAWWCAWGQCPTAESRGGTVQTHRYHCQLTDLHCITQLLMTIITAHLDSKYHGW